jgi:hypothetical protein
MALPKISSPYYPLTIPSTKAKISIRPFTVKEEKLLLMAAQSKDNVFILNTINQILQNCILDEAVSVVDLATFDTEFLFINIRARSVSNVMDIRFKDEDDGEFYDGKIDLNAVKVDFPEDHINVITLDERYKITLKYPTFNTIAAIGEITNQNDVVLALLDKLVDGETDEVFDIQDYPVEEKTAFFESFTAQNMRDIESFFSTMPVVKVKIPYISKDGATKEKVIQGLYNFFT